MLHYILVKWNPDVEKQSAAQAVRALYAKAAEIHEIYQSNAQDLMLDMQGEAI